MRATLYLIHEFDFNNATDPLDVEQTVTGDIVYSDGAGIRIRSDKTRQLWWIPNTNVRVVKVLEDDDE